MSYFNKYGFMRMEKDTPVENGILFRWYYDSYFTYYSMANLPYLGPLGSALGSIRAATDNYIAIETGKFKANPPESTQHFSRDNMYGLYGMCWLYAPNTLKNLPVFRWNNRKGTDKLTTWWHPNGWMVFLSLKSRNWAYIFMLPILVMIYWSLKSWEKDSDNTSGVCLWMSMLPLLMQQWGAWENGGKTELMLKADYDKALDYYCSNGYKYNNKNNPIREMIYD